MDTAKNMPVLVWQDGETVVAECVLIPRCRVRAASREVAIAEVQRLIAARLLSRQVEGWSLPSSYEVGHVPTLGSLPSGRRS